MHQKHVLHSHSGIYVYILTVAGPHLLCSMLKK